MSFKIAFVFISCAYALKVNYQTSWNQNQFSPKYHELEDDISRCSDPIRPGVHPYVQISSEIECTQAGVALGLISFGKNAYWTHEAQYPPGCYWKPSDSAFDPPLFFNSHETGLPGKGRFSICKVVSLSSEPRVFNDPKVVNLAGQRFEIIQIGTFTFLSAFEQTSKTSTLSLQATVQRASRLCGATYIHNLTLSGSWIHQSEGWNKISVVAANNNQTKQGMKIGFNNNWQKLSPELASTTKLIRQASSYKIIFYIKGLEIIVQNDAHQIRNENNMKTGKWTNFLNLKVKGLHTLEENGFYFTGLLAYDDHTVESSTLKECKKDLKEGRARNFKEQPNKYRFLSNVETE